MNLSNASNVLKVFYLGPIREQLNNATVLLSRIDRDESTQDVSGKNFTVPLHTTRNIAAGVGRADGGTLPTAGQQGYTQAVVPNKYVYGRIKITGPTIAATRNSAGAFIRAVESEVKGCVRDTKRALNRQLHSDGVDALAYWTGADDTSGTTVDDSRGNAFIHLISGGLYDLVATSDNATLHGTGITVTVGAKNATTYSITWSGTVSGSADNDYLVAQGSLGYQMMGIAGIINNADPTLLGSGLHGIASSSNAFWNAQVFNNSGTNRSLSLEMMQDPLSEIAVQSDYTDDDVKFLLSNVYARDKYVALLQANKRYVNTLKLDGGFTGVEFNGKPLVVDSQCRRNRIYYIVPESMKIFRSSDFDWMDMDGSVLSRVAGEDAYEAILFHYGDLACMTRNCNGLLDDITD